ncbi:MAG TPA: hypothetical protein VJ831_08295 [Jatrophihabitantaceae bacterium]|nr:hypothetical protein [Jatrophihabitantaceae bacterium]
MSPFVCDRPRRRGRALLAVLSLTASLFAASGALATSADASGSGSCGSISASAVSSFVTDWSAHLSDDAFMKAYLAGAGSVPASTASSDEQACLVEQLVASLAQTHPGFGAGRDPQLVRALLGSVIFERGKTKTAGDAKDTKQSNPASTGLADALKKLRDMLPAAMPTLTPSVSPSSTAIGTDAILAPAPQATSPGTADQGATYAPTGEPATGVLQPLPTLADILRLLGALISAVTYRVCAESATMPLKCSLPTPFGVPVVIDDTGDGKADVSASLVPLLTLTGGAKLRFTVRTIPLVGHTAPAHVYAVFSLVGTGRQFAIGFDGRPSRLATSNQMTFTLNSIVRALAGDISAGLALAYSNPGPVSAITVGAATVSSGHLVDPIDTALQFAPTPTSFTASLRLQNNATPEYTVGVQSTVASTVTAHAVMVQTAAGTETAVDGLVDKLPRSVTVDVQNNGSSLLADYQGSAVINTLAFDVRTIPDVTHPDTYTLLAAGLNQIPTHVHVLVTKPYDAVLTSNSAIGASTVSLRSVVAGTTHSEIYGDLSSVPTSVHLHGDVTGAGNDFTSSFTYTAASTITNLHFRLFDDQDLHAFVDATAQAIPEYVQVSVAKHPHDSAASFDARHSASGTPGSASVGPITLKYTSTGVQLADTDLPTTDYVVMNETSADVQAALRYTGLAFANYALHDDVTAADSDTVSAELRNAAPRVVTLLGDTPALLANAVIDSVPADMTLHYAKQGSETDVHYHASSPISSISAAVTEKAGNHASVGATVTGVPGDVQLAMDEAAGTVNWAASAAVTSVALSGQVDFGGRTWTGNATLSAVPPTWQLELGPSTYGFSAGTPSGSDAVGLLTAELTNHGTAPTETGNHAIADYNAGTGDLDASFTMTQIHSFSYTPSAAGFVADAHIGGGQPFHVRANLLLADSSASAQHLDNISTDATINPLPTSMTLTQNGTVLDYASDTSPDIDAAIAIGRADAVAATPTPPVVRGVSARDGRACDLSGCATGDRIHVFLQGAPTGLHADLSTVDYTMTHYAPPAAHNEFDADVALTSDPDSSKRLTALVTLAGIDSTGQDMHLGPLNTATGPVTNSETTSIAYTGNHAVGPLTASIVAGARTAFATVSNLPTSMTFTVTTRPDGFQFAGNLADPITSITAFYKPTGAANWALSASLGQIPRHVDFSQLTLGAQSSTDPCAPPPPHPPVPTVNYTASNGADSPDTLDITAAVDLSQLSSSLTGSITAGITNLGHSTHASWDGTALHLTSAPDTDSFEVHVPNATVSIHDDFDTSAPDPCSPASDSGFISFSVSGHLYATAHIGDAGMFATGVSDLTLTPGFSTGVQGTFDTFGMGWSSLSVDIDAAVEVDVTIDFGGGITVSPTIASLAAIFSTVAHVDFGIYQQTPDTFLTIPTPVPCGIDPPAIYEVHVSITPDRVATGHDGFSLIGPSDANGNAWIVTMNPFGLIPDTVLDAVTGLFTSPFEHGLDASFDCTDIF